MAAARRCQETRSDVYHILAYYLSEQLSRGGMDLDRSFGFLVHDVARLFARCFDAHALAALGLNRGHCRLLGYLARNEGINQAGLAELLEVKPMTLLRQIDRMERDGWIERRPDASDRRARRLVLTAKARPIIAGIATLSDEIGGEALAGLAPAEGEMLMHLLQRVHGNLAGRAPAGRGTGRATALRQASAEHPAERAPELVAAGARR
jgi:MarR family transcriptional regulator, transcriptional regulator for hemolysin